VEAYARTLLAERERRIYFVPATINYLITLEAETLIADFLAEAGKGRFIIEDDESTRIAKIANFIRKLFDMQGSVVIRLGHPIDPFGNRVDERCRSFDRRDRAVDPSSYVRDTSGKVQLDPARDAQYTRELGDEICKSYLKNTVVMATHLVAAACFERLRRASPAGDLFTVLRQRDVVVVPRDDLAAEVVKLRDRVNLLADRGDIAIGDFTRKASGGDLVELAQRAFAGYHAAPVLSPRPEGVAICDTNLLFYYQNRLAAHGLAWDTIAPPGMPPARPPSFETKETQGADARGGAQ
jgi:glycerol-3-phosphate O-acyltransferase